MKRRWVLGAAAFLLLPSGLRGQAQRLPVVCLAADTAMGPVTSSQAAAKLSRARTTDGREFVHTGTSNLSASGLLIFVQWIDSTIAEPLSPQLEVNFLTAIFDRHWAAGDSISLEVEEWLALPLGLPTPATVVAPRRPIRMEVSVLMTEEDLRSLARGRTAAVRYGDSLRRFAHRVPPPGPRLDQRTVSNDPLRTCGGALTALGADGRASEAGGSAAAAHPHCV